MIYASFKYYIQEYGGTALTEQDFKKYARRASAEIDHVTFGRLLDMPEDQIPDAVFAAVCDIAEKLHHFETADGSSIASINNDGYSVSLRDTGTANTRKKEVRSIIRTYLANTGLMYRGVGGCCCSHHKHRTNPSSKASLNSAPMEQSDQVAQTAAKIGFDETITVYNAVYDPETGFDNYSKTVISGCSWHTQHITGQNGAGFQRENVHKIRVPVDAVSSKEYVPRVEFKNPATQYTFKAGDRIVKGVGIDINRLDELEGEYNDICTIAVVHDNRRIGLKHIYVEGK